MPKKVVFTQADFDQFTAAMLKIGFRLIKQREFKVELANAGVQPNKKETGREEGFTYFMLGLRVIVWTSFVANEGKTRESDPGKVLILENNKIIYMGTFKRRTKNFFFENLYLYALAAKEHVDARPYSKCKKLMTIFQRRGNSRQCFWVCPLKSHRHKDGCPIQPWTLGLSEKTLPVLVKKWDKAEVYYNKLRAENKEPGAFLRKRKPWKKKPLAETA